MKHALVLFALVACEAPNAKLIYIFSDGASQSCGSSDCRDILIPCAAVISVRILRPNDPAAPLVTPICEPLPQNNKKDVCSISSVSLAERPIELPKETLEVQAVIWAREDVEVEDKDDPTMKVLDCAKNEVMFDAVAGFPIAQSPAPAIGGHTFYHPDDEEIRLTLGCTDLPRLRTCDPSSNVEFTATIDNFESLGVLVSEMQGDRLSVHVGEPELRGADTIYSLTAADLEQMNATSTDFGPIWKAEFQPEFIDKACIQVLEDAAQATASVRCTDDNIPPATSPINLRGVHVPKASLDQILNALSLLQFPTSGLVIGVVVDPLFNPVANEVVMTNVPSSIRYLSADRSNANGAATSSNGIFLSQDAVFGTEFRVATSQVEVGGLIQGKVTIVVIKKP